jgi:hypothetical protein
MSISPQERWEKRSKLRNTLLQKLRVRCPKCKGDAKMYYDFDACIYGDMPEKKSYECAVICDKCKYVEEDVINFFEKLCITALPLIITIFIFFECLNFIPDQLRTILSFLSLFFFSIILYYLNLRLIAKLILLRKFR